MSTAKLELADRNTITTFEFASNSSTMLKAKYRMSDQRSKKKEPRTKPASTYSSAIHSTTSCDLFASGMSTFLPSAVLHTKLRRRLGRFPAAGDFTAPSAPVTGAQVRATHC